MSPPSWLSGLGLVDVVVLLLLVAALTGALRRGAGLLGALGSVLGTAVVVWLALGAAIAWAPPGVATAAGESRAAHVVPVPHHALHQAGRLLGLHPAPGGTTR